MTVSMISCPACRTMLFSDTIVCPACRHVLDEEKAAQIGNLDDFSKSRSEQVPCRNCGEANQIGLVRCWNCSSFLREDIQEAYYEMLRSERETIYSQPGSYVHAPEKRSAPSSSSALDDDDDGDDFELSDGYQLSDSTLGPAVPTSNGGAGNAAPPAQTGDTYQLSKPAPEAPPPAENPASPQSAAGENQGDAASEQPRRSAPADNDAEDHSVATGGDVLLDIAREEEAESEKRKKAASAKRRKKRPAGSAAEKDASPERQAAQKKALARRKAAQKRAAEKKRETQKRYPVWLDDVKQHSLNPQKLKLKPGSEEKQFEAVDVGCSASGVILVTIGKKPGITLFKPKSTPEETRKEVREYLETDKKIEDLPAPGHVLIDAESAKEIKVVQPTPYVHESMFAGVPVFGDGRIAIRLPGKPDDKDMKFLSFWLTDFRKFSQAMEKLLGLKDFGHLEGVPLTDPILDLSCHFLETPLKAIDPAVIKFYEADPGFKQELIGRRCESCGLAISEDARRKEKEIFGKNDKAIAKAKCPKCENKFGSISLFQIDTAKKEPEKSSKKQKAKK